MARQQEQLSPHFWRREFECRCGCGFDTVDAELIAVLEELRYKLGGRMITITSGCRCESHNSRIGGSPKSQHIRGKAADIKVAGIPDDIVADALEELYPNKYGIGRYTGRTHIDVRSTKGGSRWDLRK